MASRYRSDGHLTPMAPLPGTCVALEGQIVHAKAMRLHQAQAAAGAEAVEGRDDILYREGQEEHILDLLFRLSSPEINEPICPAIARAMRAGIAVLQQSVGAIAGRDR